MGLPNRRRTVYLRVLLHAKRAEYIAWEGESVLESDPQTRREYMTNANASRDEARALSARVAASMDWCACCGKCEGDVLTDAGIALCARCATAESPEAIALLERDDAEREEGVSQ